MPRRARTRDHPSTSPGQGIRTGHNAWPGPRYTCADGSFTGVEKSTGTIGYYVQTGSPYDCSRYGVEEESIETNNEAQRSQD